jgi:lysophospholipase L1-like esterase
MIGARIISVLLAVSTLVGACAERPSRQPESAATLTPPRYPSVREPERTVSTVDGAAPTVLVDVENHEPPLAAFFRALSELAQGTRKQHVRVLWFGDSHTAADFMPHRLRLALWHRFGAGGPGFVHLGLKVYRHGAATVEQGGKWRLQPKAPSFFLAPQGDGIYGLGGMRTVPKDREAWASVGLLKDSLRGEAHWQILYRLPAAGASFEVEPSTGTTSSANWRTGAERPSGLRELDLDTPRDTTLRIHASAALPELFGAIIEGSEPGVVIDTLGINGARWATPLTWNEASFAAEVRARDPSLFILAYGTNEIGDELAVWRYAEQLKALVERMRSAAPEAACLIVGPTDRATPEWGSNVRSSEIDQLERESAEHLGCGYFSVLETMGGPGGFKIWSNMKPPLAQKDRVHLTPRGYGTVGDALASRILDDYGKFVEANP